MKTKKVDKCNYINQKDTDMDIILSIEDSLFFAQSILDPPEPTQALKDAVKNHTKNVLRG